MITIDKNFKIETDGNGCSLVKEETKTRINKKTNLDEIYDVTEMWHFLNVEQCLRKYVDLVQEPCETVLEVLKSVEAAKLTIKGLKL